MCVCARTCVCVCVCMCVFIYVSVYVKEGGACLRETDRQTDWWVFRSQGVTEAVPDTSRAEVSPDSRYAWRHSHAESAPKPLPGPVPLNLQRNTGH